MTLKSPSLSLCFAIDFRLCIIEIELYLKILSMTLTDLRIFGFWTFNPFYYGLRDEIAEVF